MKKVLITGGAGFIGSHLSDTLLAQGYEVTVLDKLWSQVHGDGDNDADGWPNYLSPEVIRIKGDAGNKELFAHALIGKTHLVHLAASVGVGQSMTNIDDYTDNNEMVTARMLQVLAHGKHTIERMAVASSMSVYGEGLYHTQWKHVVDRVPPRTQAQLAERRWEVCDGAGNELLPLPTKEGKPMAPESIYAINKRFHEEAMLIVGKAIGVPTVALRLFNAYGPRQAMSNPYTGVCAIFAGRLLNDQPPMVNEDGLQSRDFVDVIDVAEAFATVLGADFDGSGAYNVGSGRAITVNEVASLMATAMHKNIAPAVTEQFRKGDIRHCFASVDKMLHVFGWSPKRTFEEGLPQLVEWVAKAKKPVDRVVAARAELLSSRMAA